MNGWVRTGEVWRDAAGTEEIMNAIVDAVMGLAMVIFIVAGWILGLDAEDE